MPKEYSWEVRERGEELYIVDGLTFEQVSQATGVSERQLLNWSSDDHWQERKREYRQALKEIKQNTVKLRKNLIAKAVESLDPQDVYAVARLEAAAARSRKTDASASLEGLAAREIKTPQEAVEALEAAVEHKLNIMLAQPETLSLAGIRDMKKALDLIQDMKERHKADAMEGPERKGLSDEAVEEIRRRILGVSVS